MNYRHAYHAGNHGDVLKHAVLARVLSYLTAKDKPFRLLDAHAGIGRYDLSGPEAYKTGEWQDGIVRLLQAELAAQERELLLPYLAIIEAMNGDGLMRQYCGSPEIAVRMLRVQDKMIFNELHPQDRARLADCYAGDARVRVTGIDAAQAVKAELPFPERRGVVLLDPAYEAMDESERLLRILTSAVRRMAQTVVLAWYPFTGPDFVANLLAGAKALALPRLLHVQLLVKEVHDKGGLAGSGMLVLNPPWVLEEGCRHLVPALARVLGQGNWGRSTVEWLSPPGAR